MMALAVTPSTHFSQMFNKCSQRVNWKVQKMDALAKLERIQTRLLHRILDLELSCLSQDISRSLSSSSEPAAADADASITTESGLSAILRANSVRNFLFKRVPSDYYESTLEARRDVLGAASIYHLCKSIVLVNTQAPPSVTDCSDQNYSKYYVVVVQYTARFNAETVKNFLYTLNNGKISKKKFNTVQLVVVVVFATDSMSC
ncbi:hypothetical protein CDL12_00133 [Handroanthus impetiginosus]|uniref:Uncharacterized protein n=1 Tax=Handroanthus impetiginosus TaxID=429701 RepID=A0A2G9IBP6_9LAMI|nr:hypothetical protein CDL12_00133 [Handroanthus impetiginosus]